MKASVQVLCQQHVLRDSALQQLLRDSVLQLLRASVHRASVQQAILWPV